MIDWSKPIRIKGDPNRKVHVVTTSFIEYPGREPFVVLRTTNSEDGRWNPNTIKRNLDGSAIPGSTIGVMLEFENVPEARVVYKNIYFGDHPGGSFKSIEAAARYRRSDPAAFLGLAKLTYEDDVLISKEFVE